MRIAVIADIHGNVRALQAVRADLARLNVDRVVNLGDCLSGPLDAAATADALMREDWLTVHGNHDRWLIKRKPEDLGASDRAAYAQLKPHHLDWLRALPATARIADDVLLVHGTPSDDNRYLTEQVTAAGVFLRDDSAIQADLAGHAEQIVLCAHSHIPRLIALADGRVVFNPGSIGLPAYRDSEPHPHAMETGAPHARYGVIERTGAGWRFEHRTATYDWAAAAATAAAAARPDWRRWLATGRAGAPDSPQ